MFGQPILVDCNFVVDSTNGNGLGIRNLKGPVVKNVFMYTSAVPARGNPNPSTITGSAPPPGSPALGLMATYGAFANSAITNSVGTSIINGDMGESPGSTVTGAITVTGATNLGNGAASAARTNAIAAYTDLSTRSSTTIPSALDGQTLTAGVYSFASGAATLAESGNGTLTFNGSSTDVFVIVTASTLRTGAGGIPTIALTGGALARNVYWAVGSSATLNIGVTAAGATFSGTVLASASITVSQTSTINGRLIAGMGASGALTLSNVATINVPAGSVPITAGSGVIIVQLEDNYNRVLKGFSAIVSPTSGTPLLVASAGLTAGVAYIIVSTGTTTTAQWQALGVPKGVTPAVGVSFIAAATSALGTGAVMTTAATGSGIQHIETVGDPNTMVAPFPGAYQGFGAEILLQAYDYTGAKAAPADGSVISLSFLLNNSSVTTQGE